MCIFKEAEACHAQSSQTSGQPPWHRPASCSELDVTSPAAHFKAVLYLPMLCGENNNSWVTVPPTPGGEPDTRVCTLYFSARPWLHPREWQSSVCLHCKPSTPTPGIKMFQCAGNTSPLSVHRFCPLPSHCAISTICQSCLLLQFNVFFWIFSLIYIYTVGSLCDNIINILLVPFTSTMEEKKKKKKNRTELSKAKGMLLTTRKTVPATNDKRHSAKSCEFLTQPKQSIQWWRALFSQRVGNCQILSRA